MGESTSTGPRVLLRKAKIVDWKKVLALLEEQSIVDSDFTGDLHLSLNRGGITGCKKIETIK